MLGTLPVTDLVTVIEFMGIVSVEGAVGRFEFMLAETKEVESAVKPIEEYAEARIWAFKAKNSDD